MWVRILQWEPVFSGEENWCLLRIRSRSGLRFTKTEHSCLVDLNKYEKHYQKMYRDVGMAVPKTTETRCRDGSVQARHVIQRLHN